MFGERVTDGVESFVSLVRDYNSEIFNRCYLTVIITFDAI